MAIVIPVFCEKKKDNKNNMNKNSLVTPIEKATGVRCFNKSICYIFMFVPHE